VGAVEDGLSRLHGKQAMSSRMLTFCWPSGDQIRRIHGERTGGSDADRNLRVMPGFSTTLLVDQAMTGK
jgi:hypothetical protein